MTNRGDLLPPSTDDLAAMATAIIDSFPPSFQALIRTIPVRVQEWPEEAQLAELGLDDPLDLTGLYAGVPLGHGDGSRLPRSEPDMIYLFRQPILFEWCQRGSAISDVVFDVLTHEIGHHFGMDEAAARRLEEGDPEG
ncbi:Predicted Zn-dependent protease, minimal metalloprotease (MMP)-like domain [Arboricoccus pini]|uniref:Predicted Zn-dependent protease, minimal metalloprotease (MMP)-like domain n=1 Tax=Arboricoccus pini TaxID=1963835 RepID=A0A212Q4L9_9PROT|nr:metallopeptidase family protein [Arboricoccus pini]SNB54263.1 Predicted Zn-dependent protease, minimal metalloprotease (MMP)-like domain [Arboricoccus pini]